MPAAAEPIPSELYTAAQVRELDRIAIEEEGVPGIVLMKRAGRAAFDLIQQHWPAAPLTIFCGTGNNGGDGFIVAALAAQQHIPVRLWLVGDSRKISGDAALARDFAREAGINGAPYEGQSVDAGVVVDGLLGTGFSGLLREPFREAVAEINRCAMPVLALDVPSGLDSDTGYVEDDAVRAVCTISFIGLKRGVFTGAGPDHAGAVHFDDLAVPPSTFEYPVATVRRFRYSAVAKLLKPRRAAAHKGDSGHVLVAGGDLSMGGAVLLAATAAARCGAGLISCITRPEHVAGILAARPELMVRGLDDGDIPAGLFAGASVLAIGPGLGRNDWGADLLRAAAKRDLPMVVDADALNLIATGVLGDQSQRPNWVLTPHPGEAARLLGVSNDEVNRDRFAAATELQQRYGGVVVLKGAGTLICDGAAHTLIADYAEPALASGGTGDVLTGIIAALIAQRLSPLQAARLAVCVHAEAAALAGRQGVRGVLAGDVINALRSFVN